MDANLAASGDQAFAWSGRARPRTRVIAGASGCMLSDDVNGDGRTSFQVWLA